MNVFHLYCLCCESSHERVCSGNLIIWKGRPKDRDDRLWKTNKSGGNGDYFLGLDCDKRYIAVYRGTPNNPGSYIWRERTGGSSSPPAPTPTGRPAPTPTGSSPTPPSSRPRIKHKGSNACTRSNPCGLCEGDCVSQIHECS